MILQDSATIVAIATPPGHGGIGVIRLSGKDSIPLIRNLLRRAEETFSPNLSTLHHLLHPETKLLIDEAIITYFKAPHSFTGEDVVEVSCHGSPVILAEVLRLLTSFGARVAEPGEFTFRAFLNRRIDLTQAEAINDLIHATTNYQAQLAARQLNGEFSKSLRGIKDNLVEMIVYFESSIEFVEDDLDALDVRKFSGRLDGVIAQLGKLISSFRLGRLIRNGVKLALVGRPNVGKSSLFNSLLGRNRAIVTAIPGTTRDTVTEHFSLHGVPVELVDTAGMRETDDAVERLGVERTVAAVSDADLVAGIVEAHSPPPPEDVRFISELPLSILIINKVDLGLVLPGELVKKLSGGVPAVVVSALTGQGIDELLEELRKLLLPGNQTTIEGSLITNERHYRALEHTLTAIRQARDDLQSGHSEEIVLVSLHQALHHLGTITGEMLIGDILDQIFSTFCIGK
jgi:tRNA modification GTPase